MPGEGDKRGVKRSLAANLLSTTWTAAVAILAVPLYVRYLGMEAYGLIGLFTTLTVSLSILDLGLSSTVTREIARTRAEAGADASRADLVRTLEAVYFSVATALGAVLVALAGPLARHWVKAEHLDPETVEQAFRHMALAIAASWPGSLYVGALLGLERQVLASTVSAFFSTTKALGIIVVFLVYKPSVGAFFVWQTLNAAVQVAVLGYLVWATMPGHFRRARFRRDVLRTIWKFAAGIMAIDGTGLVLSQIDKIVLSKFLTLEAFGLFSLVSTVASNLSRVVGPVYTVYYPRLALVVARGDEAEIRRTYLDGAEVLAALVVPLCAVLALFPHEVLVVWTGNPTIADAGASVLAVLIAGRLVNAIMHLPAALQMANGWTTLSLYNNVVAIVFIVPLVFAGVRAIGPMGAALAWVLLNVGSLVAQVPIMHRRVLRGQMLPWLSRGVLRPIAAASAVALLAKVALAGVAPGAAATAASPWRRGVVLMELGLVSAACFAACLLALPNPRRWLFTRFAKVAER